MGAGLRGNPRSGSASERRLNATGTGSVTVTGGAESIVNSDDPGAAITNGGTITAPEVDITGGTTVTGGKGGFYGGVNLGTPPQPDPLRFIPEPDPLSLTEQSKTRRSTATETTRFIRAYITAASASRARAT